MFDCIYMCIESKSARKVFNRIHCSTCWEPHNPSIQSRQASKNLKWYANEIYLLYVLVTSNHYELKPHAKNEPNTAVSTRGVFRIKWCVPLMVIFFTERNVYPINQYHVWCFSLHVFPRHIPVVRPKGFILWLCLLLVSRKLQFCAQVAMPLKACCWIRWCLGFYDATDSLGQNCILNSWVPMIIILETNSTCCRHI